VQAPSQVDPCVDLDCIFIAGQHFTNSALVRSSYLARASVAGKPIFDASVVSKATHFPQEAAFRRHQIWPSKAAISAGCFQRENR
jgi:hypothetical protein